MLDYLSSGMIARGQWAALEESYFTNFQSKAMNLRQQLQGRRKDGLTAFQCFIKAKIIVGYFTDLGELVSKKYLLFYILGGLGAKYNNFVSNIQMRGVRPLINVVHNYLEGYDRMLQKEYNQDFGFQANLAKF